jgi:hypothetical protein
MASSRIAVNEPNPPEPDAPAQASRYALPASTDIPAREVSNIPFTPQQRGSEAFKSQFTPVGEGKTVATTPYFAGGQVFDRYMYSGQALVNGRGAIERKPYDPNTEAYPELVKMPFKDRQDFLEMLRQRGLYGNSKPSSTGLDKKDISAMGTFQLYANSIGRTADAALIQLASDVPSITGAGGAQRFRYTAKSDLRASFREVYRQQTGTTAPKELVDQFVDRYRALEKQEAAGGEAAPTVQTVAERSVSANAGADEKAYGFAKMAMMFERLLRSA